jgi:sister chromatid cohesion protein DCC1
MFLEEVNIISIYDFFRVVFRGTRDDKAVLCTENKTFEVKEAETSNSLLLLPNLKFANDCQKVMVDGSRLLEDTEVGLHLF